MELDLEAFFPPCTDKACNRARPHRCILPFQREIIESPAKYLAVIGGYGAGKTLPAAVLCVLLSLQVRGNRGIVLRRSYSKLHDSTERIIIETLQRTGVPFKALENRDGWPHRIILPHNGSELFFRETKDLGRFLGPEYGWFYIDEASEEPRKTFVDLTGRLRLPQAARYLRGILTTNPPHHNHWIADIFGTAPGTITKGKTVYKLMRVSTRSNPYVPEGYIADLIANNPESEVKRIIEGEYGFVFDGKPVYAPPFDFTKHVAQLEAIDYCAVSRSWDFGYHAPAVHWVQYPVCNAHRVHFRVLHEYPGRDLDAEELATVVFDQTHQIFPNHGPSHILDCGDAAGAQISDKGPGPIIRLRKDPWNLLIRYRHLPNVDPGISLLRETLREMCACGLPIFQINRTCKHTIDGLAGGYHYPTHKPGMSDLSMKPVKDGFYDNLMDSLRYNAENVYRGLKLNPAMLDELARVPGPSGYVTEPSWAWMER